jgi:hypothetical protein
VKHEADQLAENQHRCSRSVSGDHAYCFSCFTRISICPWGWSRAPRSGMFHVKLHLPMESARLGGDFRSIRADSKRLTGASRFPNGSQSPRKLTSNVRNRREIALQRPGTGSRMFQRHNLVGNYHAFHVKRTCIWLAVTAAGACMPSVPDPLRAPVSWQSQAASPPLTLDSRYGGNRAPDASRSVYEKRDVSRETSHSAVHPTGFRVIRVLQSGFGRGREILSRPGVMFTRLHA